jgi:hypothetical protein
MNWINKLFGYTYLVNLNTGEIHDLKVGHKNCHTELIATDHRRYSTRKQVAKFMGRAGFNGCRWCMRKFDADKW